VIASQQLNLILKSRKAASRRRIQRALETPSSFEKDLTVLLRMRAMEGL
jgi:hypothetical protein